MGVFVCGLVCDLNACWFGICACWSVAFVFVWLLRVRFVFNFVSVDVVSAFWFAVWCVCFLVVVFAGFVCVRSGFLILCLFCVVDHLRV